MTAAATRGTCLSAAQPYVLDDAKARRELGLEPTPWDDAVATTIAWARTKWPSSERSKLAA